MYLIRVKKNRSAHFANYVKDVNYSSNVGRLINFAIKKTIIDVYKIWKLWKYINYNTISIK